MPTLRLIFGDQLSHDISALDDVSAGDVVVLAETIAETTHVKHHQQKLVLFLSAMRHFASELEDAGHRVRYFALDGATAAASHDAAIATCLEENECDRIVTTWPGDWRVLEMVRRWERDFDLPVEIREDSRFLCQRATFEAWADGRKDFLLEDFYRFMRKRTGMLMNDQGKPVSGQWNYDKDNRKAPAGELDLPAPYRARNDDLTRDVIALVKDRFADHPGDAEDFDWAVTREQAKRALDRFVDVHLPHFGDYQDAMLKGETFMHHSILSPYLNIGLLSPREACDAALQAFEAGKAPINAVEGFIRQVLGWREYIHGLYWHCMPDYAEKNALAAREDMPALYWTADTDMACMRDAVTNLKQHAYAHHIQRLMVLGLFAQLFGIDPRQFNAWHMSMYIDSVDWVSLPNAQGMSQFADGGIVGTKPYCASGAYIDRMSNYCGQCRFKPKQASGEKACPFTTLYWDFLARHQETLANNHRMGFQMKNLARKSKDDMDAIRQQADTLRKELARDD
ncbi:MAG: cryptochrome/photolyase family protein [Gammaproteobacteria bacterium]|nr:cryptochrome/photolyase family protein [Gammaproteobacteria bacterium]